MQFALTSHNLVFLLNSVVVGQLSMKVNDRYVSRKIYGRVLLNFPSVNFQLFCSFFKTKYIEKKMILKTAETWLKENLKESIVQTHFELCDGIRTGSITCEWMKSSGCYFSKPAYRNRMHFFSKSISVCENNHWLPLKDIQISEYQFFLREIIR